eukprot:2895138-Amphidinium_carterae.1
MATGIALGQNVDGEIDHTTLTSLGDQSSSPRKMRRIRNDRMRIQYEMCCFEQFKEQVSQ